MNKKYKYFIIMFLIVASFIAFGRTLSNDFINFDDDKYITENNHIKSGINTESVKWAFTTAYFSYWHPLTWLSIMLDWNLFGANASGHHLISLLWHIGSAILLFLILSKITGSLWPSAFVAALFALHPLRVESVAWAAERKDVLSVFFGLASLYAYAYYAESLKVSRYCLCLILFALSLMAKPMLVTLPFIMLLLDYWPLGRWQRVAVPLEAPRLPDKKTSKKKNRKFKAEFPKERKIAGPVPSGRQLTGNLLWEKVPFFLLAAILSIALIWQQQASGGMASLQKLLFSTRLINAIVSYALYLGKIFWPVNLAIFYPYEQSFPMGLIVGASLILIIISLAAVYFIRKAPFLFVGWFWYLAILFPVIGLLQAGAQAMADRYTYFSSVGIAIILAWGVVHLLPGEKLRKLLSISAAVILLPALTFLTWQQCGYWKNSIDLFNHTLQVTKDNYLAETNLGAALVAEGKNEEAIAHYRRAIEIYPDYQEAHSNLGVALANQGKNEEAIAYYLAAIKIDPNYADAHYNLAISLEKLKQIDAAINHYREALRIDPDYPGAHINLGGILLMQSRYDEAIYHYRQALQINPRKPGVYFNIGVALINKGRLKEAEENIRQALLLKPDYDQARDALKLVLELEQKAKN